MKSILLRYILYPNPVRVRNVKLLCPIHRENKMISVRIYSHKCSILAVVRVDRSSVRLDDVALMFYSLCGVSLAGFKLESIKIEENSDE